MKKIGIVPYLNTIPLIHYLEGYDYVQAVPSKLCELFYENHLDAALLPVFEVLRKPSGYIINDISISSQKESGSVLFFLNTDISNLKNVGLDRSSLSSIHLLKLILKNYYNLGCSYVSSAPEYLIENKSIFDGYLLIGDNALKHRVENTNFIDLGAIWNQWTDLPFVFAVWVSREKDHKLKTDLLASKEKGMSNLKQVIEAISYKDKDFLKKYYRYHLSFDLGDKEVKGITLYQKKLYEEGFIPEITPLNLL